MLKDLQNPAQLKEMSYREMQQLAAEIRSELIDTVAE